MPENVAERAVIDAATAWMVRVEHAAWLEWQFAPISAENREVLTRGGRHPWRGLLHPEQVHLINTLEELGAYEWAPPLPDQRPHVRVSATKMMRNTHHE